MSRSLILNVSYTLVNPKKLELIALSNVLWHSSEIKHPYIKYNFAVGSKHHSAYVIDSRLDNLKILNHLSLTNYNSIPETCDFVKGYSPKYNS
jgi:hypothetical protein